MIKLGDGTVIRDYHMQDCCEHVYADWSALEDTTFDPNEITKDTLDIKLQKYGFNINGYFVPCYNEQNGYYSDALELVIKYTQNGVSKSESIDISHCVKDEIY